MGRRTYTYDDRFDAVVHDAMRARAAELKAAGIATRSGGNWTGLVVRLQRDWIEGKIRLSPAKGKNIKGGGA